MAKAAGKAKKNGAFMKPVQPSEHLAKIVGTEPIPRTEVTKKIWAYRIQAINEKFWPMINYSLFLVEKSWTCFR